MEVEIISRECIKPSTFTLSHLKIYKLSLLDQFMPPIFYSIALFYPNTNIDLIFQRSLVLKHSLSETLSRFYPLAGKIKDYVSIDCNDEGAYYTTATTNIPLSEFLTQPDHTVLKKFVPDTSFFNRNAIGAYVLMIQETRFSCGGLALGFSVSHMVFDGTALASFINAWASSASSSGETIIYPNLVSPFVFPECEAFPKDATSLGVWSTFGEVTKIAIRRLMFDASCIDKLKAKASSSSVENPSRAEVVTAIITKRLKAALDVKLIAVSHNVNIRRKVTTPFPDCSLGNFVFVVNAFFAENESEIKSLVYKVRNAIRKVDNEFVKMNTIEGGFREMYGEMRKGVCVDRMKVISFSSWCNFGVYSNSDFGWGNPIWISHCSIDDGDEIPCCNMCFLNDTNSGNGGVEAWLYLSQDVAASLDKDDQLLRYASINPSPLSDC